MDEKDKIIDSLVNFIFNFDIDESVCKKVPQPCVADSYDPHREHQEIRIACKKCVIRQALKEGESKRWTR